MWLVDMATADSILKIPADSVLFSSLFQVNICLCYYPCPLPKKQATHPNMRTYYFCTDTTKEMESWMKVMTDAALVQADPVKRFVRVSLSVIFL